MNTLRLGIIGAGVIGQRHIKAIGSHDDIVVGGIADPSTAGKQIAQREAVPIYESADALLGDCNLDGVIVATPTEHHLLPTLSALHAGLPVLVEKPLTTTLEQAEQVVKAEAKTGQHVLVGHHRRYYSLVNRAKELVQGGEMGRLVCATGQWNVRKNEDYYEQDWRRRWQAGPILTNLIHDMDLLRYICGDIRSLSADISHVAQGFEKEDAAALVLHFDNGALASFILSDQTPSPWSWECATGENAAFPPSGENAFRFMGTQAALDFPNLKLWKHGDTPVDWRYPTHATDLRTVFEDAFIEQLRHFAAVIRGTEQPRIDAADATASLKATLAVYDSAKNGKRIDLNTFSN